MLVLLAALVMACAIGSQQIGRPIDASQIARIQVGRSNKADVLRLFGPPSSYSRLPAHVAEPDGVLLGEEEAQAADVFVYEYREDRERFLTLLLYTHFRRDVLTDVLVVFFDADDVVRYLAFAKQTDASPSPP